MIFYVKQKNWNCALNQPKTAHTIEELMIN